MSLQKGRSGSRREASIFSDIPGNILRRWRPNGSIETWRQPSNMANGNAYDSTGRVVSCEHATSRVTRTESDGSVTVLATHYGDQELNSPTTSSSSATARFTSPILALGAGSITACPARSNSTSRAYTGSIPKAANSRYWSTISTSPTASVFRWTSRSCSSTTRCGRTFASSTLIPAARWENGRVWAEVTGDRDGVPDGMKIDSAGNLYVTGPGGIHIFAPDATCLGVIYTPQGCANFCWGEDDMRACSSPPAHLFTECASKLPETTLSSNIRRESSPVGRVLRVFCSGIR